MPILAILCGVNVTDMSHSTVLRTEPVDNSLISCFVFLLLCTGVEFPPITFHMKLFEVDI